MGIIRISVGAPSSGTHHMGGIACLQYRLLRCSKSEIPPKMGKVVGMPRAKPCATDQAGGSCFPPPGTTTESAFSATRCRGDVFYARTGAAVSRHPPQGAAALLGTHNPLVLTRLSASRSRTAACRDHRYRALEFLRENGSCIDRNPQCFRACVHITPPLRSWYF